MSPDFLTLDEVLEIHRDQIERYGGGEGIRDLGLLQSALAQPSATFGGQFLSRIQSIKSSARDFRSFENYRTRILFLCGKFNLLSPEVSHYFT